MSREINITILGASQSGKTCYMAGMYDIMSYGFSSFTLSTDTDTERRLERIWSGIETSEDERSFPGGTPLSTDYRFSLRHASKEIVSYDWHDYRGGLLTAKNEQLTGQFSSDWEKLKDRVLKSTCTFVCISGDLLKDNLTNAIKAKKVIGTKNICDLFHEISNQKIRNQSTDGYLPTVVIAITKADICLPRLLNDSGAIIDDIRQLLGPVFAGNWRTVICPVTLGRSLTPKADKGEIDPSNLHIPVLFGINYHFEQAVSSKRESSKETYNDKEDLKNSWLGLGRFFNQDEISYLESKYSNLSTEISSFEKDLNSIKATLKQAVKAKEIGPIKIFYGGTDVTEQF